MPVVRGSLRPSGDGSIKNFVIILTLIGFVCFIYYKLKISPSCFEHLSALKDCRIEVNRLKLINQGLKDQIELLKSENTKLVTEEKIRADQLEAARTADSNKIKEINQLKIDLNIANGKLGSYGQDSNLAQALKKRKTQEEVQFNNNNVSADESEQDMDLAAKESKLETVAQFIGAGQGKKDTTILNGGLYSALAGTVGYAQKAVRIKNLQPTEAVIVAPHNTSNEEYDTDSKLGERKPIHGVFEDKLVVDKTEFESIQFAKKSQTSKAQPGQGLQSDMDIYEEKSKEVIPSNLGENDNNLRTERMSNLRGQAYKKIESIDRLDGQVDILKNEQEQKLNVQDQGFEKVEQDGAEDGHKALQFENIHNRKDPQFDQGRFRRRRNKSI